MAWAWLVQAITEFCQIPIDGPAWQAVSSRGFRHVVAENLRRAEDGTARCLMLHSIENAPIEALADLISVFEAHAETMGTRRNFNILMCGSVDAPNIEFNLTERVLLPDYGPEEAVEALVEYIGPLESTMLEDIVDIVGGVPAILEALGSEGLSVLREVRENKESVWRLLGKLASEIRAAYDIVSMDEHLSLRLDTLAQDGPQRDTTDVDEALLSAGLVERDRRTAQLRLRAPIFSDLALSA